MENENTDTVQNDASSTSKQPEFYLISANKFWILNILTLGCFSIVWFYMQWHRQNKAGREKVQPFWRSVFAIFFYHSLTNRIKTQTEIAEVSEKWNGGLVATLVVVSMLTERILDRIETHMEELGQYPRLISVLGWGVFAALFFLIWNIQSKINIGYGDPAGASNSKITTINILWIIGFWVVLVTIATIWALGTGDI